MELCPVWESVDKELLATERKKSVTIWDWALFAGLGHRKEGEKEKVKKSVIKKKKKFWYWYALGKHWGQIYFFTWLKEEKGRMQKNL